MASSTTGASAASSLQTEMQMARPPLRAELLVQAASLIDLRFFSRATKDSQIDSMRIRCEAPREVVSAVAISLKFDLRQYEQE